MFRPSRLFYYIGLILSLCCIILSPTNPAFSANYNFERIDGNAGLYKRTITCGLQDRLGYVWFGSEDGLLRYDGYEFKEFIYNPDDINSLSSNLIYALLEDHNGMLWIGTVGGGLNKYNPKTGTFTRYTHDPDDPKSLSHNGVISLLEDSKNRIWVGTEGGGLNLFDSKSETFVRYRHDPNDEQSISFDSMWHLYEDKKGLIWIGTYGGGLNILDPDTGKFTSYRYDASDETSISSDVVGSILEDSRGNIWVGGINGLNLFSSKTKSFTRFIHDPDNPLSIGHNHIWDILEDDNGDLWFGSFGGGLNHLDVETMKFTSITHVDHDLRSLSSNLVWFVFKSKDGVMWVGTDGGGLNKFIARTRSFNHYTASNAETGDLAYSGVNGVAEDRAGTLWMANDGGGIQSFNPESGESQLFTNNPKNPNSLSSNLTETILVDHNGIVWIGTYNGGLNAYNPKTKTFTCYVHSSEDSTSISDNRIWTLFEDSNYNLWVGTRNGLNLLGPERKQFKHYLNERNHSASLSDNGIWSVFEDSEGSIWVGTDNGLNKMVGENRFEKYFNDPNDANGLSHNTTTVIFQSDTKSLWIGTNGGLNRLELPTGAITRYTVNDGLASNSIRGILQDNEKNLWITTVKGLTKFSPENLSFQTYQARDGLQGSEFSRAHLQRSDGSMVIGGRNGINIFYPEKIITNDHQAPLVLTRFYKFNREINPERHVNPNESIALDYTDTAITFEFAILDFNNPSANNYYYKLEGFEEDWVTAGNRHHASYTNLNGGQYVFRVRASNNHGLLSSSEISLPITVEFPPWKRWWAYGIYLCMLMAILLGFIELRAKRDKERIANVEKNNRKLALEVEERKKVENALVLSEQRLLLALEAAQEGMWEFNPTTGYVYYSDTWFTMLGYGVKDFDHTYETWTNLIHPDDIAKVQSNLTGYLEGSDSQYHVEFRMLAKNGDWKWILSTGKVQEFDDLGKPERMSGIHMDITSRKNSEDEKLQLESALQHASKMEAIGTLAGGVAHDFNNILSAIVGYSQLGLLEVEKETSVHKKFERILQAGYRARDLVQQILTFSRKDKRVLQPIFLGSLIDEALQLIRSTLPVTISIQSDIAPDVKHILADTTQMHQVIVNLCTNAAHAMEKEGGVLTVKLRERYQTKNEIMGQVSLPQGLYAELIIKDTGMGIPDEHVANIFNPYFTTKAQGKGTGLGLSVVLGIVQSCGGTIRVESKRGNGSTFIVLLPVVEDIETTDIVETRGQVEAKECRVLVIDDEEPLVDVLSQLLNDMGNTVVAFQDAEAAIALFKKDPHNFDVVITDMTMPLMTGDKVAKELKAIRADIPVIICTGYSSRTIGHSISELGGDALLMKPVEQEKLLETIHSVLR
ncbi:two-component regulator propeller domain-containing protein [Desulforhopalus sp. 52FAK]